MYGDLAFEMRAHRPGEHHGFEITSACGEFGDVLTVRDMRCLLGNDRSLVEVCSRVVCRCADELDAPLVGLPVRVSSDKSRKKRVVNVNDAHGVTRHEAIAEDLHVASHHHEFDAMFSERHQNLLLLLRFGFFRDRQVDILNAHVLADLTVIRVV